MLPDIFTYAPTVYLFDREYQILVPMNAPALLWVQVGDHTYYDHFAGTVRSDNAVHRVTVPQNILDEAGSYTLCWRKIIDRKPYFPESEETREWAIPFRSIPAEKARFFHASDVHGKIDSAIEAARILPDADALILNGDIPNYCSSEKDCLEILRLTGTVTKGEMPVLFARGNHDSRGRRAEILGDYIPHREGRTYFTFRAGALWGLVLDCGEDKPDTNAEYSYTTCFHQFRMAEHEFVKEVLRRADEEYNAPGILHKVVIVHHPFCHVPQPPFDIEQELYGEWSRILREEIKPDMMICGHTHRPGFYLPGGELDQLGQPCPIGVGGNPISKDGSGYRGAIYEFTEQGIRFAVTDNHCNIIEDHFIEKAGRA